MLKVFKRWRALPQIQAPPEWGIEPVPITQRVLNGLDYAVLWGDLGIGLLVILAGTFLVPALGFSEAVLAIFIGSVLGSLLLALGGWIGSETNVPTMVLMRPILGVRGSYLPTALNVLQLIGWTIFEFIVMGFAADAISRAFFGVSNLPLWTAVFATIVILMGMGGPLTIVRQWMRKFAVWMVLAITLWLTFNLLTQTNLTEVWQRRGTGTLPFWVAVDLVIAMPISWLPLVADYNRFARKPVSAFGGTLLGYTVANIWFYTLGVLVLLTAQVTQEPKGFVSAIVLSGGWLALLILLVHEADNAWADLYSSAVSLQNIFPHFKQRWLIVGIGVLAYLVAVMLDLTQYEFFLFLIGSFFVPLFGILVADYFLVSRRRYHVEEMTRETGGAYWYRGGVRPLGVLVWMIGVLVYHVTNPQTLNATLFAGWAKLVPPELTAWGGSLPSFGVAFVLFALFGILGRRHTA
jgi:putative hydroxymethylpyrimidine transporter CytX